MENKKYIKQVIFVLSLSFNIILMITSVGFYCSYNDEHKSNYNLHVYEKGYKETINRMGEELIHRPIRFNEVCDGKLDNHLPIKQMEYLPIFYTKDNYVMEYDYRNRFIVRGVNMHKVNCAKDGYFINLLYNELNY